MYGLNIWGVTNKTFISKIQILQNKAIKNLFNHHYLESTDRIHHTHKLLTVDDLLYMKSVTHIHNIVRGDIHTNTHLSRNNEVHQHKTRNAAHIVCAQLRTNRCGTLSTLNHATKQYNAVDDKVKLLPHIQFKKHIKSTLLNKKTLSPPKF